VPVADVPSENRSLPPIVPPDYLIFNGTNEPLRAFFCLSTLEDDMRKSLFIAAVIGAVATPAFADDVGVHVGPVGAGVSVGEAHDHDRDRDRDHTTVVKEREPSDRTTVIKKEDADGDRSKTVIHHDN
jgi:hypothetical protein